MKYSARQKLQKSSTKLTSTATTDSVATKGTGVPEKDSKSAELKKAIFDLLGKPDDSSVSTTAATSSTGLKPIPASSLTKEHWNCQYHTGFVQGHGNRRVWSCCGVPAGSYVPFNLCSGKLFHEAETLSHDELVQKYQLYRTPFHDSPLPAVAIDCEMGTSKEGMPELIRVTMVDYFSGVAVVDSLVNPSVPMAHLNTRYSGRFISFVLHCIYIYIS